MLIPNYIMGDWINPIGETFTQFNAISGEKIGEVGSQSLNYQDILEFGRERGGKALRKMTFDQRGRMLKALALHLNSIRKKYYPVSYQTGATKSDSWVDIEGGIGTLFAYASLRKKFPSKTFYVDGETIGLSKGGTFVGQHIMVPRRGVAIHINAFNFPIWGMLEKIAVNLLAGMPALVKASEITSFLTQAMVKDIIDSGILPEGALQLICGKGHGILDHLNPQDVVTFTGSASTGKKLKTLPAVIDNAVPFNLEADSLNCAVLGPDAMPGTAEFDLFVKEVRREMTTKAGQKCTAIRRIIVPENLLEEVQKSLIKQLTKVTIGDPTIESVRMGALVSQNQRTQLKVQVDKLLKESSLAYGGFDPVAVEGADFERGAFCAPILLRNESPLDATMVHDVEAFGPVSTIMPYKNIDEAAYLANRGRGSLVSTICTSDSRIASEFVMEAAAHHGRILVLNEESSKESTGHGSPMPMLKHGGPGRAGGGEEMGGLSGVFHYLQRCALQGSPTALTEITQVYQYGGHQEEAIPHVFRKHFEELKVGETVFTHKHTVTVSDIVNFANVSGDNFYAHVDETSLEGTIFEQRVAHGYFVLAKAAGLFVDPKKGPVLLNYGIDECRFTKPVYPGATIGVRFTVKEKIDQEKRNEEDVPKGIVKFLVDVYDETGETVALATILTMVKKLEVED